MFYDKMCLTSTIRIFIIALTRFLSDLDKRYPFPLLLSFHFRNSEMKRSQRNTAWVAWKFPTREAILYHKYLLTPSHELWSQQKWSFLLMQYDFISDSR